MNVSVPVIFFIAFAVPFGVVILVTVLLQRKAAAKIERNRGIEPAFAPVDLPPAGFLLQRFSTPERAFLLQLRLTMLWITGIFAYVFLVVMCAGLFPAVIARFGLPGGGPLSIWHSYLFGFSLSAGAYTIFAVMLGFSASGGTSVMDTFPRTRPISRRLIFWGRVVPSVAALLTAFAFAAGLSLLMLVLCYGPVYDHLSDQAPQLRVASFDHHATKNLALARQTSAPRLFLSAATTLLLEFSVVVAACSLPLGGVRRRSIAVGAFIFSGMIIQTLFSIFRDVAPGMNRFFFFYSHLGPPPPYAYAAIPITLSVGLLVLASFFNERLEI
jgi:hypothetical protein